MDAAIQHAGQSRCSTEDSQLRTGRARAPQPLGFRNALLAVTVSLAAATSCGDSGEREGQNEVVPRPPANEARTGPRVQETATGIQTLVAGTSDGGGDVAIQGLLTLVDKCVGLKIGDTDYLVIWPAGSASNDVDDTVEITIPGGTAFRLGTTLTGAGSFFSGDLPVAAPPLPASCRSGNDVVLLDSAEVGS